MMTKPIKTTETVEVQYWQCKVSDHRHRTKTSAERCINKGYESSAAEVKAAKANRAKRDALIVNDIISGDSYETLSKKHSISVSMVSRIFAKRMNQVVRFHGIPEWSLFRCRSDPRLWLDRINQLKLEEDKTSE